ncbi:MAG TPA: hypothetical protein VNA30_01720 [Mycobacteriales bacterium]|nr:hypothetical protein [Mycobacteriales bacterium]
MSLEENVERLYGLPPEEFTAARDAAVKEDRALATQLKALRKPTVSAWVVNTLVRREPDLLDQLLSLGPALAEAQAAGAGDELRMLGEQRRELVSAVTSAAAVAAGRDLTAGVRSEVEETLHAALADPTSAAAVRSGQLVRPLSYAGFGEVDLDGALAAPTAVRRTPAAAPPSKPTAKPKVDIPALQRAAMDAAGDLDDAVLACQASQRAADLAQSALDAATSELAAAEEARAAAREARTAAEGAVRTAARDQDNALAAVKAAQKRAERARAALDRAIRESS